jgi:hypothetical protein
VDRERAVVVGAAIGNLARLDGVAWPSIVHVCRACVHLVGAAGVCAAVRDEHGLYEPLYAAGPVGAGLAELQAMVGEGPGMETVTGDRPVLVTDLEAASAQQRWPLFAHSAAELGTTSVYAFPLLVGAITVGALEIYWAQRPTGSIAVTDGLLFADAALRALMTEFPPNGSDPAPAGPNPVGGRVGFRAGSHGEPFLDRWPEVHQATGMMSVQLGVGLGEAYAVLRAHAFARDQSLRAVARAVVERRLRFSPDKDAP